jgi:NitT/TauT family transport system ATP-binding protein
VFESVYLSERVVVMTQRPGRIGAEIRIDTSVPRDEAFRTSAAYGEYCGKVSAALAPSYVGQAAL